MILTMDARSIERNFLTWQALMDFGWEFCLQVYPQTYPGVDPIAKLREVWDHHAKDHAAGNERLAARLGRAGGR